MEIREEVDLLFHNQNSTPSMSSDCDPFLIDGDDFSWSSSIFENTSLNLPVNEVQHPKSDFAELKAVEEEAPLIRYEQEVLLQDESAFSFEAAPLEPPLELFEAQSTEDYQMSSFDLTSIPGGDFTFQMNPYSESQGLAACSTSLSNSQCLRDEPLDQTQSTNSPKSSDFYDAVITPSSSGRHHFMFYRTYGEEDLCWSFSFVRNHKDGSVSYRCRKCLAMKSYTGIRVVDGKFCGDPSRLPHTCEPHSWQIEEEMWKRQEEKRQNRERKSERRLLKLREKLAKAKTIQI